MPPKRLPGGFRTSYWVSDETWKFFCKVFILDCPIEQWVSFKAQVILP